MELNLSHGAEVHPPATQTNKNKDVRRASLFLFFART